MPVSAAASSFVTFSIGASIPLVPYFVGSGTAALVAAVVLGVVAALTVGALLARFTGRPVGLSALRQLVFSAIPAAITFGIGSAVGVSGIG